MYIIRPFFNTRSEFVTNLRRQVFVVSSCHGLPYLGAALRGSRGRLGECPSHGLTVLRPSQAIYMFLGTKRSRPGFAQGEKRCISPQGTPSLLPLSRSANWCLCTNVPISTSARDLPPQPRLTYFVIGVCSRSCHWHASTLDLVEFSTK